MENKRKTSLVALIAGILVLALAIVIIAFTRGGSDTDTQGVVNRKDDPVVVNAIVGSEKAGFFDDPEVIDELAKNGYVVNYKTEGSRKIASVNAEGIDILSPSSASAGRKVIENYPNVGHYTPFSSPMVISTFTPILQSLESEGVSYQENGVWYIKMDKMIELSKSGKRWSDISDIYPSPRVPYISTTDIASSNSAAMYLSILAWVVNNNQVPATESDIDHVVEEISPLFVGQGFTESSSASTFNDYLSLGMGSKPMVLSYESQYLEAEMNQELPKDANIAYPSPTVFSSHVFVALSENGDAVSRLITESPRLQELAAKHGFRPANNADAFSNVLEERGIKSPPDFIPFVDTPGYDQMEQLINKVTNRTKQGKIEL